MKLLQTLNGFIPPDVDRARVREAAALEAARRRTPPGATAEPPPRPWRERCRYGAVIGVATNIPTRIDDGVLTPTGRAYFELRNVTVSSGTPAVSVVLVSSQNGLRAKLILPTGITLTGGTGRWWNFDDVESDWSPSDNEPDLPVTTSNIVTLSDQRIAVGGT